MKLPSHTNLLLAQPLLPAGVRLLPPRGTTSYSTIFTNYTRSIGSSLITTRKGKVNGNCKTGQEEIPLSVKGAPAHLRAVIRKRQNSESAKRSRQRKRDESRGLLRVYEEQRQRISFLESRVAELARLIKEEDEEEALHLQSSSVRTITEKEWVQLLHPEQREIVDKLENERMDMTKLEEDRFRRDLTTLLDICIEQSRSGTLISPSPWDS